MKFTPLSLAKLHPSKFWLLIIAVGLISLHLYCVWKISFHLDTESESARNVGPELLSISFLFWGATLFLLWQKRHLLKFNSGVFSRFLGATIIILVVFKSLSLSDDDFFLRISPLISALGLGLLASGIQGLKQYWREFMLLFVIAIPVEELLAKLVDLATLTAQFADFLLTHLGFTITRHGTVVSLPTGAVDVNQGCSGLRGITRLLQLSVLMLFMLPTRLSGMVILPVVAVVLAFLVNGVRVAVLALLIANSHRQAFDYWHQGTGSHAISLVSVGILWFICQQLTRQDDSDTKKSKTVIQL